MKRNWRNRPLHYVLLSALFFFALGLLLLWQSCRAPVGDFANYYYGSRFLLDGQFSESVYEPYLFNQAATRLSTEPLFVNYTPVPPFSVLAYLPFAWIEEVKLAKMVFNLLGLLLFGLAYLRLVRQLYSGGRWWLLLLPLICFTPLLNNFHQGQSYLLLLAFLMEGFRQWQKGRAVPAALLWAIPVALKLFPLILFLFLIVEKDFRCLCFTLAFSAALSLLPVLFLSPAITETYFLDIAPRLFRGEINDPFATLYQSGRTILLKAFVEDKHLNPNPIANLPWLANLGHLAFQATVLALAALLLQVKKMAAFSRFALAFLAGLLLTGYGSSYSLMLLVLPAIALPGLIRASTGRAAGWALLAFAANVPVYLLDELPLGLQFPRLYALLALLGLLLWAVRPTLRPVTIAFITLLFLGQGISSRPVFPAEAAYYLPDGRYGIIHDFRLTKGGITLQYFNERGAQQSFFPTGDSIRFSKNLKIKDGQVLWKGQPATHSKSQKRQPARLNEQYILYLSDEGRGVGFWTLRKLRLSERGEVTK